MSTETFVLIKSVPTSEPNVKGRTEYFAGHIGREKPKFVFTILADRARVFPSMIEARAWNGFLADRQVGTAIVKAPADIKPTVSREMIVKTGNCFCSLKQIKPATTRYWPGVDSILAFFGVGVRA
jgi:hypothetical protein